MHIGSESIVVRPVRARCDEKSWLYMNIEHLQVDRIPPLGDGAPLHWKFSDTQTALCDQGYGSERSPEEEYPPPLPDHDQQCHHHLEPHACYPFITPGERFIYPRCSAEVRGE